MGIITTYVCDVSGKTGEKSDFVTVKVTSRAVWETCSYYDYVSVDKVVHKDVALKLHLMEPKSSDEAAPEPTTESKLLALMKDFITDIAYEAGGEAGAEAASSYNNR
ncbi:MAG: hypothetical protein ACXW1D_00210 [Halobacteriota archaeon]